MSDYVINAAALIVSGLSLFITGMSLRESWKLRIERGVSSEGTVRGTRMRRIASQTLFVAGGAVAAGGTILLAFGAT